MKLNTLSDCCFVSGDVVSGQTLVLFWVIRLVLGQRECVRGMVLVMVQLSFFVKLMVDCVHCVDSWVY